MKSFPLTPREAKMFRDWVAIYLGAETLHEFQLTMDAKGRVILLAKAEWD